MLSARYWSEASKERSIPPASSTSGRASVRAIPNAPGAGGDRRDQARARRSRERSLDDDARTAPTPLREDVRHLPPADARRPGVLDGSDAAERRRSSSGAASESGTVRSRNVPDGTIRRNRAAGEGGLCPMFAKAGACSRPPLILVACLARISGPYVCGWFADSAPERARSRSRPPRAAGRSGSPRRSSDTESGGRRLATGSVSLHRRLRARCARSSSQQAPAEVAKDDVRILRFASGDAEGPSSHRARARADPAVSSRRRG
jgi:hypothetical protein